MLTEDEVRTLTGRDVYDRSDTKIGKAGQVYINAARNEPEWLCVNTGLFGMKESFVPVRDAQVKGDDVYVAYDKDQVKNAPNIDPGEEGLNEEQENRLYDYYGGLGWQAPQQEAQQYQGGAHRDVGDDQAMTRSEERLRVDTEQQATGKARLRKYVTTEQVQTTVPVQREELRVEREPITEQNRDAALSGPEISEAEHEVTLHAERPVVETEAVPVERVRLGKETVTDEETVGGQVRKEQIDTDLPARR